MRLIALCETARLICGRRQGCPPSGKRPSEGEVIAHRADGKPVVRYSSAMPLETMQGDMEGLALYAGQSVGLVKDVKPAAIIVQQLKRETEQVFENWKLST